jgi:hypothetical protein
MDDRLRKNSELLQNPYAFLGKEGRAQRKQAS